MPDVTFETMDAIPAEFHPDVKQVDGKFVVNLVTKKKVDEFRENNISIAKERDDLKSFRDKVAPLVGDDVDAFTGEITRLKTVDQQVKDGSLKGNDQIEAEVLRRTQAAKENYERQLAEKAREASVFKGSAEAAERRLNQERVSQAISAAVLNPESGAEPSALEDFQSRARSVFSIDANGKLVAKDGDAIIYGGDGINPMSPAEWVAKQKTTSPHLFKGSSGGGAAGAGGVGKDGLICGMSKDKFDALPPAERMRLARKFGLN